MAKLCHYLHEQGFSVVMVRPLATKHERPKMSNSFTKTDPKACPEFAEGIL